MEKEEENKENKKTKIAIVAEIDPGHFMRDVREVESIDELIFVVNAWISTGSKLEAIEYIDEEVIGMYTKILSDDDIDQMAKEWESVK